MAVTNKLGNRLDVEAAIALHAACARPDGGVVLDCADVVMCGSAAAQVLVSLRKTLQASGHELTLRSVPDAMRADLSLLGLYDFINGGRHG